MNKTPSYPSLCQSHGTRKGLVLPLNASQRNCVLGQQLAFSGHLVDSKERGFGGVHELRVCRTTGLECVCGLLQTQVLLLEQIQLSIHEYSETEHVALVGQIQKVLGGCGHNALLLRAQQLGKLDEQRRLDVLDGNDIVGPFRAVIFFQNRRESFEWGNNINSTARSFKKNSLC